MPTSSFGGNMNSATRKFDQEFIEWYEHGAQLCERNNKGDPFSYARAKEIYAACVLGHQVAETLSGPDAIDKNGEEIEYKSTIGKNCVGVYNGISVQSSWPEQERYLREKKILKYPWHYFNRFQDGKLVESWRMSGEKVYDCLLPKLKKKFPTVLKKKDPRLGANVSWTQIQKFGTRII